MRRWVEAGNYRNTAVVVKQMILLISIRLITLTLASTSK